MYDTFVVEYSDPQMGATWITLSVTVDAALSGGACTIASTLARTFITQYGPLVPQAGAWWDCTGGWPITSGAGAPGPSVQVAHRVPDGRHHVHLHGPSVHLLAVDAVRGFLVLFDLRSQSWENETARAQRQNTRP